MNLTSEHIEIRNAVKKFVENEINPKVEAWEANPPFPAKEVFKNMGDQGFLGINKPEKFGGMGLNYSFNLMMAEEVGAIHCGAVPMAIGVQTDMATPALAKFGSDELRAEFLSPAIAGDMVACIGLSEATAGSDLASIKTTARKSGGDYIINGSKMWITNGYQADFICLFANTSDDAPHKNKSLILVPLNLKGVTRSEPFDKIGMRSSDTVELYFDNVKVPQSHLIGPEGGGFKIQMGQLVDERLYAAASCIKRLEWVINETIKYTGQRKAFGKTILDQQVVHYRLAELQTEVEALRSLTYRACDVYDKGEDATYLASMAKLKAGRLSREVSDACLQYWGGMGFMMENPASQSFRDGRVLSIGAGADEIMLSIIAKKMRMI